MLILVKDRQSDRIQDVGSVGVLTMKPSKTWILIADGARARLVSVQRQDGAVRIVEEQEFSSDHRANRELGRDKPARVFESHGVTRHAIEAKTDHHRSLKHEFADEVSELLAEKLAQKRFNRLVIVAPPAALGDLRASLPDAVKSKLVAEIAKDLTKTPNADILEHIGAFVVV